MGNPDLGTLNYDLPLAELEANAIRWDFPEVTILTREKPVKAGCKNISDYQIIHIASHGEFDPVNPLFSSLKLARDDEADGNFEVNEVFSLDIKADLVTLSACQTGLGEITGGDELVGLNRALSMPELMLLCRHSGESVIFRPLFSSNILQELY